MSLEEFLVKAGVARNERPHGSSAKNQRAPQSSAKTDNEMSLEEFLVEDGLASNKKANSLGSNERANSLGSMGLEEFLVRAGVVRDRARYDVFLSFRGKDTRSSFISHLYSFFSNAGIVVFKDDANLPRGNSISVELPLGIECSTISIIIFSKDYAGSRWCLNELSKIMELHRAQGRVALPVFYGVDPTQVRNQSSSFGDAFRELIQRSSPTEDEVSRWRTDLREAGGIAGFVVLNSKDESEDIKNIVKHVCKILDKKDLFIANHPVGVDSRLKDLIKISESYSINDVLLLGIWGMGGIGKTTIAKAIYNEIGRKFESRSFLSNIREVWEQDSGPVNLQQQLLSEICRTTMMVIPSIDSGKIILKEYLCHKRALVVLDDVNEVAQLNALFGSRECFGPGSRIIITTRDKHMLKLLRVDHVYEIKNMDKIESIELFSWHAFKQPSPKKGFIDFSRNIVAYSGGLPLALEILGSYLFDRKEEEWRSVLEKLKRIPENEIQKKLKISFDGLSDDTVKEIFLDISCFFIGMDRSDVTQILDGSGLFPHIGISVLVERSLVTVDEKNKLGMHDLLRDMGREIIREQSPKELGKRTRLWFHEDAFDVLSKHTGTEFVEGLALSLSQTDRDYFSTKAFKQMKTLRLLRLGNVELDGDFKYMSRDLRWLYWLGFPLKYIPANFYQKNLVSIELKYSSLKQVWREPQLLERLKILNLSHSLFLVQTPDFSKLPNLEKLILKNCPNLSKVHPTISHANKLILINLKDCTSLRTLPRSIYNLKSLKTLILSGCARIEKLEEDIEQMDSLTTLIADNTAITEVPLSLVRLKSVGYISLCGYRGLSRDVFPSLIWSRMSPVNNPLSLIPSYVVMPISLDILNSNVPSPSSVYNNLAKLRSLLLGIISENDPEVIRGAAKIWESFHARICMDMATIPNTSKIFEIESSVLTGHHSQVHISRSENFLRHLLIQIGKNDQVTATLLENISQGLTPRNYSDAYVLPGDNYPYWQCFKGERASVKFKVPRISGHDLKGMIICCAYFPSSDLSKKACESCVSVMIINYTKTTTLCYRQDSLTSFEEAEWKKIISNLDSDDQVEVMVVFGNGFTVKRTTIYLKYDESFDEQIEHPPLPSREVEKKNMQTYVRRRKRQKIN
ncbi:TMV resistance protein N [Neltuma alba]|uniref:TMV resistance protein N n=1 Tax=Neltuma alba TaxID=207710 RepID=UPI0010A44F1A|nr:TMV resistance protein N-like [Prosopis alba]